MVVKERLILYVDGEVVKKAKAVCKEICAKLGYANDELGLESTYHTALEIGIDIMASKYLVLDQSKDDPGCSDDED